VAVTDHAMSHQWNGADERPMGSSNGDPEPWKCLECPAGGKGYISRAKHWYATGQGHKIVSGFDPRAKGAPRESVDRREQPSEETMTADGQGRR
jgi:hypothetical protein